MVLFDVGAATQWGGRAGHLKQWSSKVFSESHRTPSYLLYTRAGHIPHLSWNLVERHLKFNQLPIVQFTLPSMFDLISRTKRDENAFQKFNFPKKYATHLSFLDPLGKRDAGFNNNKSVAIWVKGGRKNLTNIDLLGLIEKLPIDSFSTLFDYDTPRNCHNKRLSKSVQRSVDISGGICTIDSPLPFTSLGGGLSHYHRIQYQKLFSAKDTRAFSIDLSMFSANYDIEGNEKFDESEIKSLIGDVIALLPTNTIKLVEGAFSPSEIFFLIKLNVDLFDSSFAILLAEQGKAFCIGNNFPQDSSNFTIIDFNDKRYAEDFSPLFKGCSCYSCTKYTKAYLRHLINTKEMLAQILLVIHNLMEFDQMFVRIRKHISNEILRIVNNESQCEMEYRLAREELNDWNCKFWSKHNQLFEKRKIEFYAKKKLKIGRLEHVSANDLSVFYKEFLEEQVSVFSAYNNEWYKRNFELIWPALRVNFIRFKRMLGRL